MNYSKLDVALGERAYPIFVGPGLLHDGQVLLPFLTGQQVCIVTNDRVAPLYLETLQQTLADVAPDLVVDSVILPDGEQHKNLQTLESIFDHLLEARHNRKTTLIALGGGVVGDMCGFAAACYQRGVAFIQVPTTLLAQVDSSVGGKTGVNHRLGKNMIGAFYQPQAVVIDTLVLNSLPDRELSAGLAEVIKYGLIADPDFFLWLEQNIDALLAKDPEALRYAIVRSCEIKAAVVAQDEYESGLRAILNLGHTYGHAIETEMGYGTWLHGEAVAAGMVMACQLSADLGWVDDALVQRARALLIRAGLPVEPPGEMTRRSFEQHMRVDKKMTDERIRLVLLTALGQAVITSDFDTQCFQRQLDRLA